MVFSFPTTNSLCSTIMVYIFVNATLFRLVLSSISIYANSSQKLYSRSHPILFFLVIVILEMLSWSFLLKES